MKAIYRMNSKPKPGTGLGGVRLWWVEKLDGQRWLAVSTPGSLATAERLIARLRGPVWTYGVSHR